MAQKAEFSIQTVKKYVFWVCIPIGLLTSVGMTFVAVGNVGKAFESRKTALDGQKSTIEKIRSESEHPNESTITEIKTQTEELYNRVQQAWKTLERDQRDRNKWPDLSAAFSRELGGKKTFDEISIVARELYLNYINEYLPGLELFVDRRRSQYKEDGEWKDVDPTREQGTQRDPFSGMGGGGTGGGGTGFGTSSETAGSHLAVVDEFGEEIQRMVGTVDWPSPETRYVTTAWDSLPKSNEVWFAQEDLWVYSALLWVIKTSNAGATGPHNAIVKRIENLLIGQDASTALSTQLSRRLGGGGGGGGMDDMGMGGGDMGGGMGGMEAGGAMVIRTEEDVITVKKNRRYVDAAGNALTSDTESPFAEFNRMPVVLRLIVDQRRIPDILVNCANCAMPIDVLRVVINPGESKPFELSAHDASAVSSEGGGGMDDMGMGGGGGGMGGGMGGARGGAGGGMGAGAGATGDGSQLKIDGVGGIYGSNAVPIEIYGCINIFNPVEHGSSLRKGAAE